MSGVSQFTIRVKISSSIGCCRLIFNIYTSKRGRIILFPLASKMIRHCFPSFFPGCFLNHNSNIMNMMIIKHRLILCDFPIICFSTKTEDYRLYLIIFFQCHCINSGQCETTHVLSCSTYSFIYIRHM